MRVTQPTNESTSITTPLSHVGPGARTSNTTHCWSPYHPTDVAVAGPFPAHMVEESRQSAHTRKRWPACALSGVHVMVIFALEHRDSLLSSFSYPVLLVLVDCAPHSEVSPVPWFPRAMHSVRDTRMPCGIPGSSAMKTCTESPQFGSCATNVNATSRPTIANTSCHDSAPGGASARPTKSQPAAKGVAVLLGSVTKTGGAWSMMRQQCIGDAPSPLEWSRSCLAVSPLGSGAPAQRLARVRALSYATAHTVWSMFTSFSRHLLSATSNTSSFQQFSASPHSALPGSTSRVTNPFRSFRLSVYATPTSGAAPNSSPAAYPDITDLATPSWSESTSACRALAPSFVAA
mmetsp:Transcript_27934/g.66564  ORF Transcript_27934/g.66564 Transcript_27934/m.66564 type:complete len:347 (+) Transcript_27934:706-1746(+)